MSESKIAATDRLRREGRWDQACAFRDEERRRLRAGGMSRQDAIHEAWGLMLARFAPLDETLFRSFYVLGEIPPRNCPQDSGADGIDFTDIWWAYCRLVACCCWIDPDLVDIDALEFLMADRMQHEPEPDGENLAPVEDRGELLKMALEEPIEFLDMVEETLRDAVERIEGTDDYAEAARRELRAHLANLPRLIDTCYDLEDFSNGTVTFDDQTERMLAIAMDPELRGRKPAG